MSLRRPGRGARLARLAVLLLAVLALAGGGCAHDPPSGGPSGKGVVHVVQPGETVWRISKRYGVSVDAVVRANRIRDVTEVPVGARLWIPNGRPRATTAAGVVPVRFPPPARPRTAEPSLALIWPVQGRLSSRFGRRHGRDHEGVDVAARPGTPVVAAAAGKVIYSGRLGDYGLVVIVKHVGDVSTVYAHNRRNLVRKGEFVEQGQRIAELGSTGNATGPHLHFEVRRGQRAVDPLRHLP